MNEAHIPSSKKSGASPSNTQTVQHMLAPAIKKRTFQGQQRNNETTKQRTTKQKAAKVWPPIWRRQTMCFLILLVIT